MDKLTTSALRELVAPRSGPCVSIYMPMVRAGKEVRQNRIRYRNLLRLAEEKAGQYSDVGDALLRRGRQLLERDEIWRHPQDALAVLFDRDRLHFVQASESFDELVVVTERFHLKPLLGLLARDQRFHLLDLNRHHVRLFEGSRERLVELNPEGLPRDYREVVGRDREEPHLQWHTGSGSTGDARFHGQGGGEDDVDGELRRFIAELEPVVRRSLGPSQAPLLLAGLEPMPALYREKNRYPHLAEEEIHRNVGEADAEPLHAVVWPVAERIAASRREALAERVRSLLGTEGASNDLPEVVAAADDGRVELLFVAHGARRWGRYDRAARRVELYRDAIPGSSDLPDLAAIGTFVSGGEVRVVEPESVPGSDGSIVAAVFRYPGPPASTGP